MSWLKTYAHTHLFYIILIIVGVVGTHVWLQEHDARIAAENVVKVQELKVADLQSQIETTQQQAATKVQVITKIVHDAVTPSQVVAAIPSLTNIPLETRAVPGDPVDVTVAAAPLVQLAGEAKTAEINLAACENVGLLKDQQLLAKDTEIKALKKKPRFFKRVFGVAKAVGVGVGIGLLISGHL